MVREEMVAKLNEAVFEVTVEPVRVEKPIAPEFRVEFTTRLFNVSVLWRESVLTERLLRFKSFVKRCRPLVLAVKIYPVLTYEPSGLYDAVFRR